MKAGLELHMQVNTGKLFCRCPNIIVKDETPDYVIKRKLHAVAGETGDYDIAAVKEQEKNKIIKYNCFNDNVCLVDIDEEPPREIDMNAFKAALEIALLLNMKPVEEFHVMRKLIIDGSAVSGFQRTGLLATNGYIETSEGRVRIATLCLEEDSAKRIDDNTFSLDRLGIPLIEIATEPDIISPLHAREVAEKIGSICKFTGRLMRGIGTIRQDVNVSIPGGDRVEIKGVQDLRLMPKFVELEVQRQENLLRLKDELKKRKFLINSPTDLSNIFKDSKCGFLKGSEVHGFKLSDAKGLMGLRLQEGKSFGKDVAEHVKESTGIKGLLHIDELPNYGVSVEEVQKVISSLKCGLNDNFILVSCSKNIIKKVHEVVSERFKQALKGVAREVRAPNHVDGTTSYMRPLPGGKRMYPETDVNVIKVKIEMISEIIDNLSKTPEQMYTWLKSTGLNDELANQLLHSTKYELYEKITDATNYDNRITASLILSNPVERLSDKLLIKLFKMLELNQLCKESLPEIIEDLLRKHSFEKTVKKFKQLSTKEITAKVKKAVVKNKKILKHPSAFGVIMKDLLKSLKGKADAGVISKVLRQELSKYDKL
ncbi:MAG: Glu-tRNA(Gln) amidotransferase subunit GatE [Nanoarchaeota archaeon]|nr:Glu-tRNA(Gln) amidotransferase subunit GatE [Nanoarchaeota archaeon]